MRIMKQIMKFVVGILLGIESIRFFHQKIKYDRTRRHQRNTNNRLTPKNLHIITLAPYGVLLLYNENHGGTVGEGLAPPEKSARKLPQNPISNLNRIIDIIPPTWYNFSMIKFS